jgi:hypothetical protein
MGFATLPCASNAFALPFAVIESVRSKRAQAQREESRIRGVGMAPPRK